MEKEHILIVGVMFLVALSEVMLSYKEGVLLVISIMAVPCIVLLFVLQNEGLKKENKKLMKEMALLKKEEGLYLQETK